MHQFRRCCQSTSKTTSPRCRDSAQFPRQWDSCCDVDNVGVDANIRKFSLILYARDAVRRVNAQTWRSEDTYLRLVGSRYKKIYKKRSVGLGKIFSMVGRNERIQSQQTPIIIRSQNEDQLLNRVRLEYVSWRWFDKIARV